MAAGEFDWTLESNCLVCLHLLEPTLPVRDDVINESGFSGITLPDGDLSLFRETDKLML